MLGFSFAWNSRTGEDQTMRQLILATGNGHKVAEFDGLLAGMGFEVLSASVCGGMPEVDETGATFAANARLKAEALAAKAPEDTWVLADDSGLEVDALDGAPGVYSARYAGLNASDAANRDKLLEALRDIPDDRRTARFRCVLCLFRGLEELLYEGRCEGRIAKVAVGNKGFGYDPIFIPEGHEQTFGELGERVKARLSHRAKAVAAFRDAFGSKES